MAHLIPARHYTRFPRWFLLSICFSFLLSLFFIFVIPPFQKADEYIHFYKSLAVSQGNFLCKPNEQGVPVNQLPSYLVTFPFDLETQNVLGKVEVPIPRHQYIDLLKKHSFDTTPHSETAHCSLPFLYYLPSGLALTIPVGLQAHPMYSHIFLCFERI